MKIKANLPILSSICLLLLLGLTLFPDHAWAEQPVYGQATEPTWRALYWNDTTLSGQPVLTRDEAAIDYNWGAGSPDASVNTNGFSARWTRVVDLPAGRYRFTISGDDGVRVYVNDQLFLNGWWDHGMRTFTTDREMAAGSHEVRVEFYERGGAAIVKFGLDALPLTPTATPTVGPTATATPTTTTGPTATSTPVPPPSGKPPINAPADNAWRGEYFNNENLIGAPAAVRDDSAIDFDWGHDSPIPGVIGDYESVETDSFYDGILGAPQYTRPPEFRGMEAPAVLREGNHAVIRKWRRKEALRATKARRPDLLEKLKDEDQKLLRDIENEI